jgi:serine/threonine-protein kinase
MEKINGIDLGEIIAGAELPFSKKIDIAIQSCKGLSYAHKNGVIHRDIKPSNIIIDNHGNAKILDFGIALSKSDSNKPEKGSSVIGTMGYIAPEQTNDYTRATIASDIFSFGMLLKNLFSFKLVNEKSHQSSNKANDCLLQIIEKCTSKEPSKRFDSLNEIRDLLLAISQGSHLEKSKLVEAKHETKELTTSFNLLDVMSKNRQKRVYLFQKKSNKQLIVIKRQLGNSEGLKQAKILSSLKHPNIVQILAAAKKNGNFVLITEYLSGGSLANQLLQDMSEQEFLTQACQICSAIHFAHQNNIQHSNLSTDNILYDSRQNIKIGDFGQIRAPIEGEESRRKYHPPGQQSYSEQYDIYCMGAIFYHMLFGVEYGSIVSTNSNKVSFRLQQLIDSMLSIDPINRPTTAQQVLVQLQRIAKSDAIKNQSSSISKKNKRKAKGKPNGQDPAEKYSITFTLYLVASMIFVIVFAVDAFYDLF